jgi:2-dehydro-3-deoxygluconokinase
MKKVVTFGEIMLRLVPPGFLRIAQARSFDALYAGAEANVAMTLANLGVPADFVTPQFIKDMLGPCPWSKLMPSGGMEATRESIFSWIKAGAAAVNMGSNLIAKDLVKAGNFEAIKKKVEDCVLWIKEARGALYSAF